MKQFAILGAGQLSLMLLEEVSSFEIFPLVIANSKLDPALRLARTSCIGGVKNLTDSQKKEITHLIFENEFFDANEIRKELPHVQCIPSLNAMEKLHNKLRQKEILQSLDIPTSHYIPKLENENFEEWIEKCEEELGGEFVIKWAYLGYDGKGVHFYEGDQKKAKRFCEEAKKNFSEVYAEALVDFSKELAMVGVRSARGEFNTYPMVISEQENGICRYVFGKATNFGVSPELERKAKAWMKKLSESLDYVGTFAFEFFEDEDSNLLVNEIAPRVHNTGHYTQDCAKSSQFENHWRACLGLPLGDFETEEYFSMINLLGNSSKKLPSDFSKLDYLNSKLHWYFKTENRKGRKLGHINYTFNEQNFLNEWDEVQLIVSHFEKEFL